MDWKDIGAKIVTAAPLVGSLFGPAGTGIGMGVKLLASLFGLSEAETTPEAINSLLSSDPQALIKIKQMELDNQIDIRKYILAMESLAMQDTAGARTREVEVVKATGTKDINLYILAWTVIAGFFVLIYVLTFEELPDANVGPVNQLYGVLGTGFGVVLAYFFGSSKSSSENRSMLDRALIKNGK